MKNLCIIGNGFDIHHGLETSYSDFRNYLVKAKKMDYVTQLETFFQSEYLDKKGERRFLLWSNLEKAIGLYDLDELYNELTDWVEIDDDHMMQTSAQIEDSPEYFLEPVVKQLPSMMENWISKVKMYGIEANVKFPDRSTFLTFNYTRVLEEVYHIPDENILHIHGSVGGGSELVVGHRVKINENEAYDENAPIYQEEAKINIIRIMDACRKRTEEIIANNRRFFNSLHSIDHVYVYGHSYSTVDKDYFEVIHDVINNDAEWNLGWHSENDKVSAERLLSSLGVAKQNRVLFMF